MILKGSRVSEQRLALPQPPVPALERLERESGTKPEVRGDGLKILESVLSPPVMSTKDMAREMARDTVSKERELTFEAVAAWLAVQDETTRKACASVLSTEITQVFAEARAEGMDAGRKAAERAAQMDVEARLALLGELSDAAETAYALECKQLELICVDVITESFANIAGPMLRSQEAALGAVQQVLKRVRDEREITIRVSRDDVAILQQHQPELADALSGRKFQIVADGRIELGGCIVETRLGSFDGRFEVQLRELYETLRLARTVGAEAA